MLKGKKVRGLSLNARSVNNDYIMNPILGLIYQTCGGSQLSALTDPKGNTWAFAYDQYGRMTNTTNPLGQAKDYNYDKMSRVTEVKDSAGNITFHTCPVC